MSKINNYGASTDIVYVQCSGMRALRAESIFHSRFSVSSAVRMLLVDDDGRCRDGLVEDRELG